jgi:hypothetical protein
MSQETHTLDFLRHRRALWLQLASAIETAQTALLAHDFKRFLAVVEIQSNLCSQLGEQKDPFDGGSCRIQRELSRDANRANRPSAQGDEWLALVREVSFARARVRHANRVQAAFLKYAGRSARTLCNTRKEAGETYDERS